MNKQFIFRMIISAVIIFLPLIYGFSQTTTNKPVVKGDGIHDDTQAIQALLDSKQATIYLPKPSNYYLISKTLKIYSGQTLIADRNAVIRLADHAGVHLLTNADWVGGDERIAVIGGIWDGNNLTQTTLYHQDRNKNKDIPYNPDTYIGVLMVFDNVKNLHIADVTFKDPEMFAFLGGNLSQFTIENITFDFNLRRGNMDGIHIAGNSHYGRIVNLKGTTNDDLVALNADDVPLVELSSGPITDIQIDGIWSEDGFRAIRINSCGSPVKRVKISNVFGTYRNEAIVLSNHKVHPDCISTFEDISISNLMCSNSPKGGTKQSQIRIFSPAHVSNLAISDYHRTEEAFANDNVMIDKGVQIDNLSVSNSMLNNKSNGIITFINNLGTIGNLNLANIFLNGKTLEQKVQLIINNGEIHSINKMNVNVSGKAMD